MDHPIRIDQDACTGCGACVPVCVNECIALDGGLAAVVNDRCIECDHCVAACPVQAIASPHDDGPVDFGIFAHGDDWLAPGEYDQGKLVQLMRSRRSFRHFRTDPVEPDLLRQLCHVGASAPSGTNSQRWTFTILPGRKQVMALGSQVAVFFKDLNRLAAKAWVRAGLALFGQKELSEYYHEYYPAVADAIRRYEEHGEDRLFHGAPAVILVGSMPGASCPAEDALLATQNILLAAHAAGLGTCLIGYAVEAMRRKRSIQQALGWGKKEEVYAVIAVGHPDESYTGLTGRKPLDIRMLDDLE